MYAGGIKMGQPLCLSHTLRYLQFDTFSDMLGDDKIANELLLAEDVVERIRYRVTCVLVNEPELCCTRYRVMCTPVLNELIV